MEALNNLCIKKWHDFTGSSFWTHKVCCRHLVLPLSAVLEDRKGSGWRVRERAWSGEVRGE